MSVERFLLFALFGFNLGFFLGYVDIYWNTWKYWVIIVPTILLFSISLDVLKIK